MASSQDAHPSKTSRHTPVSLQHAAAPGPALTPASAITASTALPSKTSVATRPTLLPAFEPILSCSSSSPTLPRPAKRKFESSPGGGRNGVSKHYPTPVPTSATGILSSSSPSHQRALTRPGMQRTASMLSERVPLGAVPSVELPADGEPLLMGRSSNSCHYQLSTNRQISRVHIRALFRTPAENIPHGEIFIECVGWNSARIHCQGRTFDLEKGHTFSSDRPLAEIMLDVQDARVLLQWPSIHRPKSLSAFSDAITDEVASPSPHESFRHSTPTAHVFGSSPPQESAHLHLHSPVSPSPRNRSGNFSSRTTFIGRSFATSNNSPTVQVYEDQPSSEEPAPSIEGGNIKVKQEPEINAVPLSIDPSSSSSPLSDPEEFSDRDEENDPIVHSFGPYGSNILPRLASISAASPDSKHRTHTPRQPLKATISPRQPSSKPTRNMDSSPIRNHVINQLAFSRLHSLPLSTILKNIPLALTDEEGPGLNGQEPGLTEDELKLVLDRIPCVGEIVREGKDAAGKPLEDEFYYLPELDTDGMRRNTVEQGLGKPGLRSVRKQHKQYYWKRPRH